MSLVNTGFNKSDCWAPLGSRGPVLLTGRKGIRDRPTETVCVSTGGFVLSRPDPGRPPRSPRWSTWVVCVIGILPPSSMVPEFTIYKSPFCSTTGSVVCAAIPSLDCFIYLKKNTCFHIGFMLVPSIPAGLQSTLT